MSAGWDRTERPKRGGESATLKDVDGARALDRLLGLVSPAVRCEPGLLRSLRLLLDPGDADVGSEFDVWNHSEVWRNHEAIVLQPDSATRRRESTFQLESSELKNAVVGAYYRFHEVLCPSVLFRELKNLRKAGAAIPKHMDDSTGDFPRRASATLFAGVRNGDWRSFRECGLAEYTDREMVRIRSEASGPEQELAVSWVIAQVGRGASVEEIPKGIDPKDVAWVVDRLRPDAGPPAYWDVRLVGGQLRFVPWNHPVSIGPEPDIRIGVPLSQVWGRPTRFDVEVESAAGERHSLLILPGEGRVECSVGQPREVRVSTDMGRMHFRSMVCPDWAKRFGYDRYGMFVELEVREVGFRLRWIPPGTFLMGSPEDEVGRDGDEGPRHTVTITRGFWLAETPCTQAQWSAVMGKNPSQSKGEFKPAENVSWSECVDFGRKLSTLVPGLTFRLPTEAQWEYACRAGTDSAFHNGSACTEPRGKNSALDRLGWFAENSGNETHPVRAKDPNAWGLYDMHGNVWEWCADEKRRYEPKAEVDPERPGVEGAGRVLRGGGSWITARRCRSAFRGGYDPGDGSGNIGFRLAAESAVEGSGAGRSGAGGADAPAPEAPAKRGTAERVGATMRRKE